MKKYIGTKVINATPMTRLEYNQFRHWELPANENGDDAGYLVEYIDGGAANTPEYAGYVSWSPIDVFENAYRPVDGISFGLAVEALKKGFKVARAGWNGKGMWLEIIKLHTHTPIETGSGNRTLQPLLVIKRVENDFAQWQPSATDCLADDWQVVEYN